jgi:hypothetical protein
MNRRQSLILCILRHAAFDLATLDRMPTASLERIASAISDVGKP